MNRKFLPIIAMLAMPVGILALSGCQKAAPIKSVACTEEAKVCPDGSAVGRTGPDCSFAPCPEAVAPVVTIVEPMPPGAIPEAPTKPPVPPKVPVTAITSEKRASFGKPVTLRASEAAVFPDSMTLVLNGIGDSRCPKGVQCVWAGELAPLFISSVNGISEEVRLGTGARKTLSLKGYDYILVDATEVSATVKVSVSAIR